MSAEAKLSREPADHQTPERLFEREWAHSFAGVTGGTATLGYFLGDAADHRTTTIVVRQ